MTEIQFANPKGVGVRRGLEPYMLRGDSEIECLLNSAAK